MKWFKHISESGDDPDIGAIMDKFGSQGYYLFFRTIEIMAKEFDVHNPGRNSFNFHWFLERFRRGIGKKSLLNFLNYTTKLGRIKSRLNHDTIYLNCPKLKELADEYTEKMLKKIGTKSRRVSGQNPSHKNKKKEPDKEGIKNNMSENVFDTLWKDWPKEGRFLKGHCFMKFNALVKAGKLGEFRKTTIGYFEYLKSKKIHDNFDQKTMHLKTWMNNWEGEKDTYMGFEHEPRL